MQSRSCPQQEDLLPLLADLTPHSLDFLPQVVQVGGIALIAEPKTRHPSIDKLRQKAGL
jgi:hypothetical protein